MVATIDFTTMTDLQILQVEAAAAAERRRRGMSRTRNAPLGDYAEHLVSTKLLMTLAPSSAKGFDATDRDGLRVQIKSTQSERGSAQLSAVRGLQAELPSFDYLLALKLSPDYRLLEVLKVPHEAVKRLAGFSKHTNSGTLHINDKMRKDPAVVSIALELFS
jgi:hypothetical protein